MSKKLTELVFAALDNAYEGGYGDVLTSKPEDEAINLLDYDADIAEYRDEHGTDVMDIVPIIEAWRKQKDADLNKQEKQEFVDREDEK